MEPLEKVLRLELRQIRHLIRAFFEAEPPRIGCSIGPVGHTFSFFDLCQPRSLEEDDFLAITTGGTWFMRHWTDLTADEVFELCIYVSCCPWPILHYYLPAFLCAVADFVADDREEQYDLLDRAPMGAFMNMQSELTLPIHCYSGVQRRIVSRLLWLVAHLLFPDEGDCELTDHERNRLITLAEYWLAWPDSA